MRKDLGRPRPARVRDGAARGFLRALVWAIALSSACVVAPNWSHAVPDQGIRAVGTVESGLVFAMAPGVDGRIHRFVTRVERGLQRLGVTLIRTVSVWVTLIASALACLLVIGFASVADRRMFDFRRHGLGATARDLLLGTRTFARMLRDRRTPFAARALVIGAVVYWLLPVDFLTDAGPAYGIIDDLIGAVIAGKGFVALCPDTVIAASADVGHP